MNFYFDSKMEMILTTNIMTTKQSNKQKITAYNFKLNTKNTAELT